LFEVQKLQTAHVLPMYLSATAASFTAASDVLRHVTLMTLVTFGEQSNGRRMTIRHKSNPDPFPRITFLSL